MEFYKKNKIDLITGKKVITINKDNKKVTLQCGLEYLYNKLIIATGSDLKKLPVSCNKENILYLRTIEDARLLKKSIEKNKKLVIIGAGYIGLEIAASAVKQNTSITLIEMEKKVMSRSVSSETADFLQKKT